jgi:cobalt-zinc-cadmium efflux system membrane fusion protein
MTRALFSVLFAVGMAAAVAAHEGHDHGDAAPPAGATVAPRGEAQSDAFELVVVARGGALTIYLDRFADNAPVEGAGIEVETPDGPAQAQADGAGVYRLAAPWSARPGHYDLVFTVTAGGDVDVLPVTLDVAVPGSPAGAGATRERLLLLMVGGGGFLLGLLLMAMLRRRPAAAVAVAALMLAVTPVLAHDGHDHGDGAPRPAGRDIAQRLPDGSVFVPKETQRILAIRTAVAGRQRFARSVEMPGRVIPDPNASGLIQSAVGGRLSPPSGGFRPLGARVKAGDVLATVTPPIQAIDVSDMRQRQGELDQQIAIVKRRVARYEGLAKTGAVAQVQLEEAQLELDGLLDRRAALDTIRREPEALVAPVAGILAEGTAVAGQMVQPDTVIFRIVDPARLWVEALSFAALTEFKAASARTSAGQSVALAFRGAGFTGRSQSIPVHFAIEGNGNGLRVGQLLTVFGETGETQEGIALPRTAVVRAGNGQWVAFEHVTAERFMPRVVRTEPLDGARVLIVGGVEAGKRIVVQGAELLEQVR